MLNSKQIVFGFITSSFIYVSPAAVASGSLAGWLQEQRDALSQGVGELGRGANESLNKVEDKIYGAPAGSESVDYSQYHNMPEVAETKKALPTIDIKKVSLGMSAQELAQTLEKLNPINYQVNQSADVPGELVYDLAFDNGKVRENMRLRTSHGLVYEIEYEINSARLNCNKILNSIKSKDRNVKFNAQGGQTGFFASAGQSGEWRFKSAGTCEPGQAARVDISYSSKRVAGLVEGLMKQKGVQPAVVQSYDDVDF